MFFLKRKKPLTTKLNLNIEGNNFFFLLLSLLALIFLWPLSTPFSFSQYLFTAILFTIFSSSLHVIGKKNLFTLSLGIFFIITITGLRILHHYYHLLPISLIDVGVTNLYFFFLLLIVSIHVLKEPKISLNSIYGIICSYLLLGLTWGLIYYLTINFDPTAIFIPIDEMDSNKNLSQYVYYSFITLTSVGYGDIHPISPVARSLAMSESIIGQAYFVVLIGWSLMAGWRK
jgi:voltage-gated potassium channel